MRAADYLAEAKTHLRSGKRSRDPRIKVFELVEAVAIARLSSSKAGFDGAKIRSDAGHVEYQAREALCLLIPVAE